MAGARCDCERYSHLGEERIMAKLDVRKSGTITQPNARAAGQTHL